jgi:DNA-binding CsgD family transcriptional regulator
MQQTQQADIAAFSDAIDGLYAAATGALTWSDALSQIATLVGSAAGALSMHDPVSRVSRTIVGEFGTDPSYSASFNTTYGALSSAPLMALLLPEGKSARMSMLEDQEQFFKSRFYKEWCAPQGYRELMCGVFIREPRALYGIGFVRFDDQPHFNEEDEHILDLLMPHVARAFHISGVLETLQGQRDDLLSAIDALPTPVIALDADIGIVSINRAAIALSQADGPLRVLTGNLVLRDADAQQILAAAFVDGRAKPITISLGEAFNVSALLTPYDGSARRIAALLTIQPTPTTIAPPGQALQQAFGFTNSELRILVMMLEGGTRNTIAQDLGLSLATVKTHIHNLFAKTQTDRQADLVRVVMGR